MNKIRCTRCDRKLPCSAVLPLLCGCGHRHFDQSELQQVDAQPGLPQKVLTATTAYTRWLQAGMPRRSAEEKDSVRAICSVCPAFKNGRCGLCGCDIDAKAEMATEHCPMSRPKW